MSNVKPIEYALMCRAVYEKGLSMVENLTPAGWTVILTSDFNQGFKGAIFFHPDSLQVVLAIRGTVPTNLGDLRADYDLFRLTPEGRFPETLNTYVQGAELLLCNARNELVRLKFNLDGLTYSVTGHSLGAIVAEVVAIKNELHATTFDSPGSRVLLQPQYDNQDILNSRAVRITTFLSAPNLVNTLHPQIALGNEEKLRMIYIPTIPNNLLQGSLTRLFTALGLNVGAIGNVAIDQLNAFVTHTLCQHSIAHIVNAFNPSTGEPYHELYIQRWPRLVNQVPAQGVIQAAQFFLNQDIASQVNWLNGMVINHVERMAIQVSSTAKLDINYVKASLFTLSIVMQSSALFRHAEILNTANFILSILCMLIASSNIPRSLLVDVSAPVLHEADQTHVLGAENFLFLGNRLVLRSQLKNTQQNNGWLEHSVTCSVFLCGFLNLASLYKEKNSSLTGIEFLSILLAASYIFQKIAQPALTLYGTIKSKSSFYQDPGATDIVQRMNRFRTIQNPL